jgi:hypothetical protein
MHFNSDNFVCLKFWPYAAGEPPQFQYKGPRNHYNKVKLDMRDLSVQLNSDLHFGI